MLYRTEGLRGHAALQGHLEAAMKLTMRGTPLGLNLLDIKPPKEELYYTIA